MAGVSRPGVEACRESFSLARETSGMAGHGLSLPPCVFVIRSLHLCPASSVTLLSTRRTDSIGFIIRRLAGNHNYFVGRVAALFTINRLAHSWMLVKIEKRLNRKGISQGVLKHQHAVFNRVLNHRYVKAVYYCCLWCGYLIKKYQAKLLLYTPGPSPLFPIQSVFSPSRRHINDSILQSRVQNLVIDWSNWLFF